MKDYILITPVKNEEDNLPLLVNCIVNQTILPKIWILVDGNSNDDTLNIIEILSKKYEWIHLKKQEKMIHEKNHMNFAIAVKEGYEYGDYLSKIQKINYEYVGKIDADVIISDDFFDKLISKFEQDINLGVATGESYDLNMDCQVMNSIDIKNENCIRNNYLLDELPDKRLYRKNYLDNVGGFPISKFSPDTILLAKFRIEGWGLKTFRDVQIYNLRKDTGTERNLWDSAKSYGHNRYYLNYNPLLVFVNLLLMMIRKPYYPALGYFIGYISSFIRQDEKIDDRELRNYFMHQRHREILNLIISHKYKK